jgi:lipoprotein-releasing system permease protein
MAALANKVRKLPNVKYVTPVLQRQALLSGPHQASGVYIRGLTAKSIAKTPKISKHIVKGSLKNFDDGIVIGRRLGQRLGVNVGEDITLLSPQGVATPFGMLPRSRRIKVVAFFNIGMSELDNGLAFLPLKMSQEFLNASGIINKIEIGLKDPNKVEEEHINISKIARDRGIVQDWRQTNATLASALKVERNVMFLILTMIIMIAAMNIISGLVFLVKDKAGEIAMLRAMGVTRKGIMRIFFITGSGIGVLGTLAGFLLAFVFCQNIEEIRQAVSYFAGTEVFSPEIYFLSQLPADMDPGETSAAIIMALALTFAATIYPARRAANIYPAEALRYE